MYDLSNNNDDNFRDHDQCQIRLTTIMTVLLILSCWWRNMMQARIALNDSGPPFRRAAKTCFRHRRNRTY